MLTFRSSFVESWCKGSFSEDELIARASMLGVNLQLDNYAVVLFTGFLCDDTDRILDSIRSVREMPDARELPQGAAQQYVRMIMEEVPNFSNKEVSLETLVARLNMHPSYLGSISHQQTGYYFNDYLNEERLKYAAKLMENGSIRLKDIADMTGFSSQT